MVDLGWWIWDGGSGMVDLVHLRWWIWDGPSKSRERQGGGCGSSDAEALDLWGQPPLCNMWGRGAYRTVSGVPRAVQLSRDDSVTHSYPPTLPP